MKRHNFLYKIIDKLLSLGINDSISFVDQKRVRTLNAIIFVCLPVIFVYWLWSYTSEHYLLARFYIILTLPLFAMLYFNYKNKRELYRIVSILVTVAIMAVGSVLFNNGQEYYILLTALLSILFYDLKKLLLYLSIFYACVFVAIKIISKIVLPVEQAPEFIEIVNIIVNVSILVYFLFDIKKMYIKFLEEILSEKQNLADSNTLLVKQAITLELKNKDIEDLKNKNEELSSIVYHQLRSPIVAFSDILSQYVDYSMYTNEEFKEMSKKIQHKVSDTLTTIDGLLLWKKNGIKSMQPTLLECEINEIMQKTIMQVQPMVEKKKLQISYEYNGPQKVYADSDHVLIIFQNILNNAIKFSPLKDTIQVNITNDKGKCQVCVTNNGEGINPQRLQRLFSTMHITSANGTTNESGIGLGLKICKKLVEKNKGSITIRSVENKNTSVLIELPASI